MGRSSHTNTSQIWAAARRGGAAPRPRRRLRADFEGPVVRLAALLGAAGFGALAEYFFLDRQHAARRRHTARDRARASVRRGARGSVRRAKYLEGVAEGIAHRTGHALPGAGGPRKLPDDVTLAQKVASTAFRKSRVPKERVSVNAENGVVFLRGQLDNEQQIQALVHAAAAVEGVREVKSLLHTPSGTTTAGP